VVEASIHPSLVAVDTNRFHVLFASAIEQLTIDPSKYVACPDDEALEEGPIIAVVRSEDEALEDELTSEFVFDISGSEDTDASVAIAVNEPEVNEPAFSEPAVSGPVLIEPVLNESGFKEPAVSDPVLIELVLNGSGFNGPTFNGSELYEPALINSALLK